MTVTDSSVTTLILETAERFEKCAVSFEKQLNRLRKRVARFRKSFVTRPTTKELEKVIDDLQAQAGPLEKPDVSTLLEKFDKQLGDLRRSLKDSLIDQLRKSSTASGLTFKVLPDGLGIGPFSLLLNTSNETIALTYAKTPITKNLPLDAEACIAQVRASKAILFDEPVALGGVRCEIEEAMRVSLTRKKKSLKGPMRVDLPQVFRELEFIRQSDRIAGKEPSTRHSLSRFVVELSTLIQSEENLESKKPLRLETAVLENTKDNRRSFFIPKDLNCGYGEGTYYQALLLEAD